MRSCVVKTLIRLVGSQKLDYESIISDQIKFIIGDVSVFCPTDLLSLYDTMYIVQACAKELLRPGGEIAAVAGGFDVIAFSTAPVSWGACYEGHLQLLEGASKPLTGRQNGRRPFRPNSASTGCTRVQVCSLPSCLAKPDCLSLPADASCLCYKSPGSILGTQVSVICASPWCATLQCAAEQLLCPHKNGRVLADRNTAACLQALPGCVSLCIRVTVL